MRTIFHIDVNSAYLSWEAVRRRRDAERDPFAAHAAEPDLREIPSIIGGDPNRRTSIVLAKSVPAKKYGIVTGEPVSAAIRKCPGLVIAPSDFALYSEMSHAFKAILREYSPVVESFSVDECFLDMTGMGRMFPDPVKAAHMIKDRIKGELGFTVNVGISSNKLLAKMASDFEKPDKVHTLWESEVQEKMWPLGVRDLLWVGKKTEARLTSYGIRTIGDLATIDITMLTRLVGRNAAIQLHEYANGRDDSPVETEVAEAKSYSAERTFSKDLTDPVDIDRALFNVACIVAHRIRRDHFRASTVSMFIKYTDFSVAQKQCQVPQPTDVTAMILNEARRMLHEVWDGVSPLRQVGLGVSKLTHENYEQMSLFEDPRMEYYREWDRQYDEKRALAEDARMLAYERK